MATPVRTHSGYIVSQQLHSAAKRGASGWPCKLKQYVTIPKQPSDWLSSARMKFWGDYRARSPFHPVVAILSTNKTVLGLNSPFRHVPLKTCCTLLCSRPLSRPGKAAAPWLLAIHRLASRFCIKLLVPSSLTSTIRSRIPSRVHWCAQRVPLHRGLRRRWGVQMPHRPP